MFGLREKTTPVPDLSSALPKTIIWTTAAVPSVEGIWFRRRYSTARILSQDSNTRIIAAIMVASSLIFRTVSIIPGIEIGAEERTET